MEHHVRVVCQTVSKHPQRDVLWRLMPCVRKGLTRISRYSRTICAALTIVCCRSTLLFPACFRFISLERVEQKLIQRCENEKTFDIFILLDKTDEQLERVVDASHLALHCTPVINLFEGSGASEAERRPA